MFTNKIKQQSWSKVEQDRGNAKNQLLSLIQKQLYFITQYSPDYQICTVKIVLNNVRYPCGKGVKI